MISVATRARREGAGLPPELRCDVAGVLTVALRDAEPRDARAVARDLGEPTMLARERATHARPRLDVSFVDRLPRADVRLLDGGVYGSRGAGMYALTSRGAPRAWIEQGTTWGAGSIVCTRGLGGVPFLAAALDLAALAAEWAPLHASAWVTPGGVGVIASGWAHSGKTGALLAAREHGSRPIGDDRVLLSADGGVVLGLGRPARVKDWHIAQLGSLGALVGRARSTMARVGYALARRQARWGSLAQRAVDKARGLATVELDIRRDEARPRVILLMEGHYQDRIIAERADPASVAARLAAHACAELAPVLRAQLAYDYAHPGTGWRHVDEAPQRLTRILERAVRDIPAWTVRHPYPCSLQRMHVVTAELAASVA